MIGPVKVHVDGDSDLDQNVGRVASVNVERDVGGSGACQGAPHKEGQEIYVALCH